MNSTSWTIEVTFNISLVHQGQLSTFLLEKTRKTAKLTTRLPNLKQYTMTAEY